MALGTISFGSSIRKSQTKRFSPAFGESAGLAASSPPSAGDRSFPEPPSGPLPWPAGWFETVRSTLPPARISIVTASLGGGSFASQ